MVEDLVFAEIPAGSFLMGSPPDEPGREPHEQQRLIAVYSFWLAKTEVNQEQFQRVMGFNPSLTRGPNLPVTCVSYTEAVTFCQRLHHDQYRFRLPTEEEWEYACRAGSRLPFGTPFGQPDQLQLAWDKYRAGDKDFLCRFLARHAWIHQDRIRGAGTLQPNAWGIHDMHGNVWEWCFQDGSGSNGCPLRGGAWSSTDIFGCRAAFRASEPPESRKDSLGFRVAAEIKVP